MATTKCTGANSPGSVIAYEKMTAIPEPMRALPSRSSCRGSNATTSMHAHAATAPATAFHSETRRGTVAATKMSGATAAAVFMSASSEPPVIDMNVNSETIIAIMATEPAPNSVASAYAGSPQTISPTMMMGKALAFPAGAIFLLPNPRPSRKGAHAGYARRMWSFSTGTMSSTLPSPRHFSTCTASPSCVDSTSTNVAVLFGSSPLSSTHVPLFAKILGRS